MKYFELELEFHDVKFKKFITDRFTEAELERFSEFNLHLLAIAFNCGRIAQRKETD